MIYANHVVKSLEKTDKYDSVLSFQEGYSTKFTSLFHNPNKVAWIHCNYNYYLPENESELSIYEKYNKIVCVSRYTAKVFVDRYPTLSERTIAIHNIIDSDRILKLSDSQIDDSRFIKDDFVIISVGRISPVKRFREIPLIASSLKNKRVQFTWYIIGPQDGSGEVSELQNNIERYSVQECVKWLGGKSNPYPYFKTANLYVCLSESEACPMVFKEAQLFGLPIVTTDFPSAFEFVNDKQGVIVPYEFLPDAICQMLNKIDSGYKPHKERFDNYEILTKIRAILDK